MNIFNTVNSKTKKIFKEIPKNAIYTYKQYASTLDELSKYYELQNKVGALSNYSIVNALIDTLWKMAYMSAEPNLEFVCRHLEEAVRDLLYGMNAVDMLHKYDLILYEMKGN